MAGVVAWWPTVPGSPNCYPPQQRVDFARRIPLEWGLAASLLLACLQLATGTGTQFALLSCTYLFLGTQIYTVLGGLYRITGGGVAALFALSFLFPVLGKIALRQPCDSFLYSPLLTLSIYNVGALGMLCAAYLSRVLRPSQSVASRLFGKGNLLALGWVAYGIGSVAGVLYYLHMREIMDRLKGGIGPISASFTPVLNVAVVCSTAHCIRRTGGKRSLDAFTALTMSTAFVFGFLDVGKAAMLAPLVAYALTCFGYRLQFRWRHGLAWLLGLGLVAEVMFPYAQIARTSIRVPDPSDRLHMIGKTISDIGSLPNLWRLYDSGAREDHHYLFDEYYGFGKQMGFLDRMNMLKFDDYLISGSVRSNSHTGWNSILIPLQYLVPSAIRKGKPEANSGNFLGHFTGTIADKDLITQITFTLSADSYASLGWFGVLIIPFLLSLLYFLVYDSLFGSISESVWCVALFGYALFHFSENFIGFMIFDIIRVPILTLGTGLCLQWLSQAALVPFRSPKH